MRYLIYLVVSLLIAATVCQCGGLRARANQIRVTRARRIDEAGE